MADFSYSKGEYWKPDLRQKIQKGARRSIAWPLRLRLLLVYFGQPRALTSLSGSGFGFFTAGGMLVLL